MASFLLRYPSKLHGSRTRAGLNYATGPCINYLNTCRYGMIVIELAELLGEWWFPLPTSPSRADQSNTRRLGDTVRGGIEAGGLMKCPRTGVGLYEYNSAVWVVPYFCSCKCLEEFLNLELDPVLWCWRCMRTSQPHLLGKGFHTVRCVADPGGVGFCPLFICWS